MGRVHPPEGVVSEPLFACRDRANLIGGDLTQKRIRVFVHAGAVGIDDVADKLAHGDALRPTLSFGSAVPVAEGEVAQPEHAGSNGNNSNPPCGTSLPRPAT